MITQDKNLVSNQYTAFGASRFSHSDCGSSAVKTYAIKRTLLKEKEWPTVGSNQQPFDYIPKTLQAELRRLMYKVGFKLLLILYSAIYIATMLSVMYNSFIII